MNAVNGICLALSLHLLHGTTTVAQLRLTSGCELVLKSSPVAGTHFGDCHIAEASPRVGTWNTASRR
jgi:hypothetical protein